VSFTHWLPELAQAADATALSSEPPFDSTLGTADDDIVLPAVVHEPGVPFFPDIDYQDTTENADFRVQYRQLLETLVSGKPVSLDFVTKPLLDAEIKAVWRGHLERRAREKGCKPDGLSEKIDVPKLTTVALKHIKELNVRMRIFCEEAAVAFMRRVTAALLHAGIDDPNAVRSATGIEFRDARLGSDPRLGRRVSKPFELFLYHYSDKAIPGLPTWDAPPRYALSMARVDAFDNEGRSSLGLSPTKMPHDHYNTFLVGYARYPEGGATAWAKKSHGFAYLSTVSGTGSSESVIEYALKHHVAYLKTLHSVIPERQQKLFEVTAGQAPRAFWLPAGRRPEHPLLWYLLARLQTFGLIDAPNRQEDFISSYLGPYYVAVRDRYAAIFQSLSTLADLVVAVSAAGVAQVAHDETIQSGFQALMAQVEELARKEDTYAKPTTPFYLNALFAPRALEGDALRLARADVFTPTANAGGAELWADLKNELGILQPPTSEYELFTLVAPPAAELMLHYYEKLVAQTRSAQGEAGLREQVALKAASVGKKSAADMLCNEISVGKAWRLYGYFPEGENPINNHVADYEFLLKKVTSVLESQFQPYVGIYGATDDWLTTFVSNIRQYIYAETEPKMVAKRADSDERCSPDGMSVFLTLPVPYVVPLVASKDDLRLIFQNQPW